MTTPTMIAGYLALFIGFGLFFLFINLVVGKFLRPKNPNLEKLEIYECGEPTIGSSFVQFDIRFYVVALLFIIFDVEIAFFFPWAAVFGKATKLMDPNVPAATAQQLSAELAPSQTMPTGDVEANAKVPRVSAETAKQMAGLSIIDIMAFFAVLMVGFAYVWRRGDLDWVRAVVKEPTVEPQRAPPSLTIEREPAISA